MVKRHKPSADVQAETAAETVGREADSAAEAPELVLIVPEADRALGVSGECKAGMRNTFHGGRAPYLQPRPPSGPSLVACL